MGYLRCLQKTIVIFYIYDTIKEQFQREMMRDQYDKSKRKRTGNTFDLLSVLY